MLLALPANADTRRRMAASRLRETRRVLADAEAHLDEVVLALAAGATGLSRCGASDELVLREARERLFSCRRALDDIRLELLTPEHLSLNPNDEDDLHTALTLALRANEEAEAALDAGSFTRLTPGCVGVATRW